jgi:hypothetical protein
MTNKIGKNENKIKLPAVTRGGFYEIRIKGQLDDSWSDWLEGLEVKNLENGEMILSGIVQDQAALMGILNKLYGLNLILLSLNQAA